MSLKELTLAADYPEIGRFRVSLFRQNEALTILLRSLPEQARTLDGIGMPTWIKEFTLRPEGLILIASPTGQGKSTTANALVDHINRYRRVHLVTIEDPIEVVHQPQKSNVSQRQIGRDVKSVATGLKHCAHLVADVIMIDDLKEPEAIAGAIQAAAAGHLVIATIEAGSTVAAVETLIHRFDAPAQPMMRQQLAHTLLLCVSQRLIEQKEAEALILAYEKMESSSRVRTLIREGRTYQIGSQLQSGSDDFQPIDEHLAKLFNEGRIEFHVGQTWSTDRKYFRELTGQTGASSAPADGE
jgi:twitching motility protein PilT